MGGGNPNTTRTRERITTQETTPCVRDCLFPQKCNKHDQSRKHSSSCESKTSITPTSLRMLMCAVFPRSESSEKLMLYASLSSPARTS